MIQHQKCNKISSIQGLTNEPQPNSKLPYITLTNKDSNLKLPENDSVAKMQ